MTSASSQPTYVLTRRLFLRLLGVVWLQLFEHPHASLLGTHALGTLDQHIIPIFGLCTTKCDNDLKAV